MAESLVATGLYKSYGRTALLCGIDLRAKAGELILIQGGNGAGKSTLLRLLAGREKPNDGRIYVNGRSLKSVKGGISLSNDRRPYLVVRAPQSPRTFSSLAVSECFRLVANDHSSLFRSSFEDDLDMTAGTLSGGRRKILTTALSLETGAQVILLDEPEAGLDSRSVNILSEMLSTAKVAGYSLIVCAHQPSQQLKALSDHNYWLYEGHLHQTPKPILQQGPGSSPTHIAINIDGEPCAPASLLVSGIRIRRNQVTILENISFELKAGQAVSISGMNGSGKSSLALSLLGLIDADGEIELEGQRVDQLPPHYRVELGMSFMPQAPRGLFYDMTVEENLRAVVRQIPRRTNRLEWTWDVFPELLELKTQLSRKLSGGLQRLLTLAMVLRQNPRLLILDEPLAGLSGDLASRVISVLGGLLGRTTVLIFEHRAEEISAAGIKHIKLSDLSGNKGR